MTESFIFIKSRGVSRDVYRKESERRKRRKKVMWRRQGQREEYDLG